MQTPQSARLGATISAIGAAIAVGCALGILMRPEPPPPLTVLEDSPDTLAELEKARARISELESLLAEASKSRPAAESAPAVEKPAAKEEMPSIAKDPSNLVILADGDIDTQLKSQMSDAEYGVVSNVFATMRAMRAERSRGRLGFLESVDTSKMSESDRSTHAKYLDLLSRQEELSSKSTGIMPDMATLAKQVELQMELKPLAKAEREILLGQMTGELGYSGEEASVIHDTIGDIVDATSAGSGVSGMIGSVLDDIGMENIAAPGISETPKGE